jgi:folate-binding protein YgfZ
MTAVMMAALDPDSPDAGVPAHFGDPNREQRILATAVGLVDRSHRGVLAVPGADRLTWLHSLTTQHLTALAPAAGTETLLLSPHGHVEHHAMVFDDGATTWLDVEPGTAGPMLDFLSRMVFLMQVAPTDVTGDWATLAVVGPDAPQALARLGIGELAAPSVGQVPGPKFATGAVPPQPTSTYPGAALAAIGGWVRRTRLGYDLLVPRPAVAEVRSILAVADCGIWAYEALRVAAGIPRLGWETDHRTIPAECVVDSLSGNGWLAGAVHLDKGCYRGQETVARVHNLGRPPRQLAILHLDGVADELPARHTEITPAGGGRALGYVGTAVRHHELGMIALAMLKRSALTGADLRIGSTVAAIDG